MQSLTIRAYAKLNLVLEILGRRADGFHRLETIFQTIGLHDVIELTRNPQEVGVSLVCNDQSIPSDSTNLAWRAASVFIGNRSAEAGHVSIRLQKGIPHGAGLGGGSSDAAAVLRGLNSLLPGWHAPADLHRMACALGSDVPFFLVGGTAVGEERGEILTPLADVAALPVTVLMPQGRLPTPAVFAALTDEERGPRPGRSAVWWKARLNDGAWPASLLGNRLTDPAVRLCPAVGELLAYLHRLGVPHLMSGSGAACFALGYIDPPAGVKAWHTTFVTREQSQSLS
jgi:4-diphosphocytidyl-2-C-methyl-D-erythritol kinase